MAIKYEDIEQIMAAAERDARADVGEEFTDDMVVDLASSVLIGQPYGLVREWCRRHLGFTPASLRPVRPKKMQCEYCDARPGQHKFTCPKWSLDRSEALRQA